MRVLKFGGTSVTGRDRLEDLAGIVGCAATTEGVVVVVSAMAGTTDRLEEALERAEAGSCNAPRLCSDLLGRHLEDLEGGLPAAALEALRTGLRGQLDRLARRLEGIQLLRAAPEATRYQVLATGERLSAPRVTTWLRQRGLEAQTVDGAALIHAEGDPVAPATASLEALRDLSAGQVAVVTGFVGRDSTGRSRTLGRGASDLSATLLGAALGAEVVEIWSDVPGVLDGPPSMVGSPRPLARLDRHQASFLARFGAQVLHPRSLEPLRGSATALSIRWTARPDEPGTRIEATVPGITEDRSRPYALAVSALGGLRRGRWPSPDASAARRFLLACAQVGSDPLLLRYSAAGGTALLAAGDAARIGPVAGLEHLPHWDRDPTAALALLGAPGSPSTALQARLLASLDEVGVRCLEIWGDEPFRRGGSATAVAVVPEAGLRRAARSVHAALVAPRRVPKEPPLAAREDLVETGPRPEWPGPRKERGRGEGPPARRLETPRQCV